MNNKFISDCKMNRLVTLFLVLFFSKASYSSECTRKYDGFSSFACVCDASYCNYDDDPTSIAADQVRVLKSSQDDYRNNEEIFQRQDGTFDPSEVDFSISVDPNNRRQSMIGFGGAMTDAAGINIKSLSQAAQDNLIRMYFGSDGSRYSIIRVPIAGSDFSTHPYTYDDVDGDVDLVYFDLTDEDYSYKIPLIKQAVEQSPNDIYVFGSPWSPPAWMKTNGMINGSGELLTEMYQPYSNYLLKFFQKYEENLGIELWGFTPENEPLVGFQDNFPWNNCGWTPENMRDWIKTNLGPTLSDAGYRRLNLILYDHNRDTLASFVEPTLTDADAEQYVDGIAIHWYADTFTGPEPLQEVHGLYPSKFMLYTEACTGAPVELGNWNKGELYITNIIEDINNWSGGWVDWNLALDLQGGPNWVSNFVDAPIIVDASVDEFYIQPLYYALNIFSRNVERGSTSIYSSVSEGFDNIKVSAFENTSGQVVLIIANVSDDTHTFGIVNENGVYIFKYTLEARTWLAVTYQK